MGNLESRATGVDGFACHADHPLAPQHALIDALLVDVREGDATWYYDLKLKDFPAGVTIGAAKPQEACRFVVALNERLDALEPTFQNMVTNPKAKDHDAVFEWRSTLAGAMQALLRRKLPFDEAQLGTLMRSLRKLLAGHYAHYLPHLGVAKATEDYVKREPLSDALAKTLGKLERTLDDSPDRDLQKTARRLRKAGGIGPAIHLDAGEAWADAALKHVAGQNAEQTQAWALLLEHCAGATAGKPSAKWSKTARALADALPAGALRGALLEWFVLVDLPRTLPVDRRRYWQPNAEMLLGDYNANVLKGLVWCTPFFGDGEIADALGKLALSTYRKVPGVGPRATKIGNACLWALGELDGDSALAALAILKVRVKFKPAQKGIGKALDAAAERAGLTRDELEEIGVPAYGMERVGVRDETFGDYAASLVVVSATKTQLRWTNPAGKPQKSVPKAVRENFADELKELRQAAKDIDKMLAAQRDRLDNMFLAERSWRFEDWRARYIDHPLVGTLARRLIWTFDDGKTGIWRDGDFVDASDRTLTGMGADTPVHLWHPIASEATAVMAWREWLHAHEVTQPFKQAHREIYLLTDAERRTDVYSNRFAAHIVKQHQFNALCGVRDWRSQLRLMVDADYEPPTLELANHGLRAEFWVEGVGEDYGTDTTESGSYLYLLTDQVRFYRTGAAGNYAHAGGGGYATYGEEVPGNQPLALTEVPPLVLSEVFRDVDLFVGVASVGNDPNWSDGGPEGRYVEYWHHYSFGALGESAKTRKETLERLLPRLKIHDRCELSERFLIVRGDLRTYKIHLGSANILMEPNDQYLCIVPAQGRKLGDDRLFLPFEGDSRMAVILSKAFLLAEDKKIKDSTIVSQIKCR